MKNLVIGNSSQLSYFFPENYEKISSRNINISNITNKYYNKIFLTFAEQRTYLNESLEFFTKINVDYTISIIDKLIDSCNSIIVYSTAELWNNYEGCVSINDKYNYNYTYYIRSKEILCEYIRSNAKYNKVIIVYPFNFNSIYRKGDFLFAKIYKSIVQNNCVTVGDINFYRDIIHPQIVVDLSISANEDVIVGSGLLINIQQFVSDMYSRFNKNFYDYVTTRDNIGPTNTRKNYYSCKTYIDYSNLLSMYVKDIYDFMN